MPELRCASTLRAASSVLHRLAWPNRSGPRVRKHHRRSGRCAIWVEPVKRSHQGAHLRVAGSQSRTLVAMLVGHMPTPAGGRTTAVYRRAKRKMAAQDFSARFSERSHCNVTADELFGQQTLAVLVYPPRTPPP